MRGYPSQPLARTHGEPEGESEGYAKMCENVVFYSLYALYQVLAVCARVAFPQGAGESRFCLTFARLSVIMESTK
jgi:hypothetical protein